MREKLEELTKTFEKFIKNKDNKNGSDVLDSLITLQANIMNKKSMIDQKTNKIESK